MTKLNLLAREQTTQKGTQLRLVLLNPFHTSKGREGQIRGPRHWMAWNVSEQVVSVWTLVFNVEKSSTLCMSNQNVPVFFFYLIQFFFFFLWLYLWHKEVPRPGIESELQLQPTPQPQQLWIQAASMTYTAVCGNARSLATEWCWESNLHPHDTSQVLNPLSHNGNSKINFF